MKKILLHLVLLSLVASIAFSQTSYNMNFRGQWFDNSLPGGSVRYNDLWGYSDGNRDYALMGSRQYVHFIEVTNAGAPIERARIGGGANTTWRDIKTYQNYAYAVSESSEGLLVFDLSGLPNTVTLTAQLDTVFTSAHNLFIDGGFAYIVGAPRNTGRDLIIYDLRSTPQNPTHWGSFALPNGYAHDIFVDGSIAYASHEGRGLSVYDLQNTISPMGGVPLAPVELGRIDSYFNPGYNHSSWAVGNLMVMADETHGSPLSLVDISDYETMTEISYFISNLLGVSEPYSGDGPIVHNPFLVGNLCYVSHYHDGVVVFDISNPTNVEIAAYYDTEPDNTDYSGYQGCWGVYPFLGSDKILASDVQRGLFVLQQSFSLPNLPLPVSWGPFTATAKGDKIELNWSTYAETENKGFHVERQNQAGKFVRIGWLEPEPDQTYSFVDQAPHPARNYYRLAQEDWDGSINYSRVVSAALVARADAAIVPNPSQAGAIVTLQNEEAWNYPLRLYGPDGRCWRTYADRSQPLILPSTLPTGVYVLMDDTGWKQKLLVN